MGDSISRESVLVIIERSKLLTAGAMLDLIRQIEALPSTDGPEGEWIYCENDEGHEGFRCSECGFFVPWCYEVSGNTKFINKYHTCPYCDSRMKGARDE